MENCRSRQLPCRSQHHKNDHWQASNYCGKQTISDAVLLRFSDPTTSALAALEPSGSELHTRSTPHTRMNSSNLLCGVCCDDSARRSTRSQPTDQPTKQAGASFDAPGVTCSSSSGGGDSMPQTARLQDTCLQAQRVGNSSHMIHLWISAFFNRETINESVMS